MSSSERDSLSNSRKKDKSKSVPKDQDLKKSDSVISPASPPPFNVSHSTDTDSKVESEIQSKKVDTSDSVDPDSLNDSETRPRLKKHARIKSLGQFGEPHSSAADAHPRRETISGNAPDPSILGTDRSKILISSSNSNGATKQSKRVSTNEDNSKTKRRINKESSSPQGGKEITSPRGAKEVASSINRTKEVAESSTSNQPAQSQSTQSTQSSQSIHLTHPTHISHPIHPTHLKIHPPNSALLQASQSYSMPVIPKHSVLPFNQSTGPVLQQKPAFPPPLLVSLSSAGVKQPGLGGSGPIRLPSSNQPPSHTSPLFCKPPLLGSLSSAQSTASIPQTRVYAQPEIPLAPLPGSKALLPPESPQPVVDNPLGIRSGTGAQSLSEHNSRVASKRNLEYGGSLLRLPAGPATLPVLPVGTKLSSNSLVTPTSSVSSNFPISEHNSPISVTGETIHTVQVSFQGKGYTELPKRVLDTPNVVRIAGGDNNLTELPLWISKKTELIRLEFQNNQFKDFPNHLLPLFNLKYLDFSRNKLSLLPTDLIQMTSLATLILSGNKFKIFPLPVCHLKQLEHLDMSSNRIKQLPPILGNMTALTELNLHSNEIEGLPTSIGSLSQLTKMTLHHNHLSHIPAEMASLCSLEYLDLSWNLFSAISSNICYTTKLVELKYDRNEITTIHENISKLINLTSLDISGNRLTTIPMEIAQIPLLKVLGYSGNPLTAIPSDKTKDQESLMAYLKELKSMSSWRRMKLVFVGEEFVGKTSLRMQFSNSYATKSTRKKKKSRGNQLQGNTNENSDPVATDGIDIEDWEPIVLEGASPVVFSTWDFAGQQIYHPTHQFFLTKRSMYLIVFNLLDERSSRVEYWLKTLKVRTNGTCPVIIVGTHRDDKKCDKKYVKGLLDSMRKKYDSRFPFVREYMAVSSKTGAGIAKLTEAIVELARANRAFQNIPQSYLTLEKKILQIRTTTNTMVLQEFYGVATDAGVQKDQVLQCLEFMHDVGIVLYFNDESGSLSDLVILDPMWIVNLLSSIITLKHGYAKEGILLANCLPQIWKEYPPSEYNWLLKLLEKFEITFRISQTQGSTSNSQRSAVTQYWLQLLSANPQTNPLGTPPLLTQSSSSTMDTRTPLSSPGRGSNASIDVSNDLIVIPSLLPSTPSDRKMFELWRDKSLFNSNIAGRRYIFQFLPLGFFSRLIVRTLHLTNLNPQYVWRNGMIVDSDSERAILVHNELDYCLDLIIKSKRSSTPVTSPPTPRNESPDTVGKRLSNSFNLLRLLSDNIETLLVSWFKLKPIVQVPCHLCLREKDFGNDPDFVPYYFAIEECMLAVREGKKSITCLNEARAHNRKKRNSMKPAASESSSGGIGDALTTHSNSIPTNLLGSVLALKSHTSNEAHECLLTDLCADIAFSDVQDLAIDFSDLELINKVGEGSYAILWKGTYKNEVVAVKVLKQQESQMDLLSESFRELQHETFVMKNLKNPFLVELKGICISPLAMVMDFFALGSLDKYLHKTNTQRARFSWKYRVRVAFNIARGMDYLHSEDLIHRDLRSPNILLVSLDENCEIVAKVADFGLAVICARDMMGGDFNECWTAPEILKGSQYNAKIDQYSFGIVLWELLETGFPFFEYSAQYAGKPRLDFFNAVIGGLRPSFPKDCPQDYQNLVSACWASEPDNRPTFARIAEMLAELEPIAAKWDAGDLTASFVEPGSELSLPTLMRKRSKNISQDDYC